MIKSKIRDKINNSTYRFQVIFWLYVYMIYNIISFYDLYKYRLNNGVDFNTVLGALKADEKNYTYNDWDFSFLKEKKLIPIFKFLNEYYIHIKIYKNNYRYCIKLINNGNNIEIGSYYISACMDNIKNKKWVK